jgi:cell shape-determining protein MreC
MPPFKPNKRSVFSFASAVRAVLIFVALLLVFLIVDAIVDATRVPSLRVKVAIEALSSKQQLIEKIGSLEESLGRALIAQEEAQMLRRENEALKKELGRESGTTAGVLARVLTLPQRTLYDTIIIDAGSAEGVVSGAVAFAFDAIALGTITDVGEHRSTVQLFSAPGRQTSAYASRPPVFCRRTYLVPINGSCCTGKD